MKVLLVNPPNENLIAANVPSFVEEDRGVYPPLGLLYIAGSVRKLLPDVDIKILDTQCEEMSFAALEKYVEDYAPDIVGVQVMTFTAIDCMLASTAIKKAGEKIGKDIKIIWGGRHVNIYPTETINLPNVDYVMLGDGELQFVEFLKAFPNVDALKKVDGLVFKVEGKISMRPPQTITDLDSLAFPARDLSPYKKYRYLLSKDPVFTTMMTSRGCPFTCIFCDEGHRKYRMVSAPRVVEEIEECVKMGIKNIFVYDSTFTVNRQRIIDICDLIVQKGIKINLDVRTRVDLIDEEMFAKLRKAGCNRIQFGIESGNEKILNVLSKKTGLRKVEWAVKTAKSYGFEIFGDFIIGNPEETREDLMDTLNLSKKLPFDYAHFAIMIPYPDTKLYEMAVRKGMFKDYWREFARNPTPNFKPQFWEEHFKIEELLKLLGYAYKSFYGRPTYIARQMTKIRSVDELRRKVRAGIKVLTTNPLTDIRKDTSC